MGWIRGMGWAALVAAAFTFMPATAATVTVTVAGGGQQPVADAVVSLVPTDAGSRAPLPRPAVDPAKRPAIRQRGEQFEPFILPVQAGTVVAFPNEDPVRHHVFSFSPTKPFELRLYGRDQVPTITFDKAGVVAVGCNIHDHMRGYVYVTDTPYFASTDARGSAQLSAVPPGRYTAILWHPRLRAPSARLEQPLTIADGATEVGLRFSGTLGQQPRQVPPDSEKGRY